MPFCCLSLRAPKPKPDGYTEHPETLGEHLRKRRMDLGLFQRQAAAEIGVSTATLWNWSTATATRPFATGPRSWPSSGHSKLI